MVDATTQTPITEDMLRSLVDSANEEARNGQHGWTAGGHDQYRLKLVRVGDQQEQDDRFGLGVQRYSNSRRAWVNLSLEGVRDLLGALPLSVLGAGYFMASGGKQQWSDTTVAVGAGMGGMKTVFDHFVKIKEGTETLRDSKGRLAWELLSLGGQALFGTSIDPRTHVPKWAGGIGAVVASAAELRLGAPARPDPGRYQSRRPASDPSAMGGYELPQFSSVRTGPPPQMPGGFGPGYGPPPGGFGPGYGPPPPAQMMGPAPFPPAGFARGGGYGFPPPTSYPTSMPMMTPAIPPPPPGPVGPNPYANPASMRAPGGPGYIPPLQGYDTRPPGGGQSSKAEGKKRAR